MYFFKKDCATKYKIGFGEEYNCMFRKCMFEKVWVIQLKQLYLWHDCLYVQYEIYVHVQIMWSGSSISKLYTIPQYIIKNQHCLPHH